MARCVKKLSNGKRCKVNALKGQKYCLFHSTKKPQSGGGKPFRSRSKRERSARAFRRRD